MKTGSYINSKWFHTASKQLVRNINPADPSDIIAEFPKAMSKEVIGALLIGVGILLSGNASASDRDSTPHPSKSSWPTAGQNLQNTRHQITQKNISSNTVHRLIKKWEFDTAGDVIATPIFEDGYLYFPDSEGWLYKVNSLTGALVWSRQISEYTGIAGDYARGSPAISGNLLILGNMSGRLLIPNIAKPAQVFAVNKYTGAVVWNIPVDDTTYSFIAQSPIVYNNIAYVGIASNEELISGFWPKSLGFEFQFRGSVVAIDIKSQTIKWKTYTVPLGYTGGSVWGGQGAVDEKRNQLYIATGNNYSVPSAVMDCLNEGVKLPGDCLDKGDNFDSVLALNLDDGAIKWATSGMPYDIWNAGCGFYIPGLLTVGSNDNCPALEGEDLDFAQGPMLIKRSKKDIKKDIVGVGQKNGKFWAFNADNGNLEWVKQVSPSGFQGGLMWGSASDDKYIYVANANSGSAHNAEPLDWQLQNGHTTKAGGWSAINSNTGKIVWEKVDPRSSSAQGAVSVANGVMFGCNIEPSHGTMYALNAETGKVLWSYDSGGACIAGPSIVDGMVYWGTGKPSDPLKGPHKVLGFGFPGSKR